jgi:TRAP transporter TAXI family solute receptor
MGKKLTSKKMSLLLSVLLLLLLITACSSNGASNESSENNNGSSQNNERLSIATNPVGSAFNALGNGLASVISLNSDVQASVQPYAGVSAWAPPVNRGEVALGVANGPELIWAFNGENQFKEPLKNLRLIVRGNYISASGIVVREDSGIKTVADLKGKRLTSDYPGSLIGKAIIEATLVSNGLTWDDVNQVPTPTIVAGINALQDDRVDGAFALVPSSPVIMEAHNAVGLHGLNFVDGVKPSEINNLSQDILDGIQKRVPSARMTTVKPKGYIAEEVVAIEYPSMMVGSTHLSDEPVYEMLETLWAKYEELHPVHAWFKSWSPELMFDPNPEIPYHPAAVKFFKDKGLWSDEVEKVQQELLDKAS